MSATYCAIELEEQLSQLSPLACEPVSTYSSKRMIDVAIVLLLSPIWLPLVVLLGLAVKLSSDGPIFFGQLRVGRYGGNFRCWKLRSMACDAEDRLKQHLAESPEARAEWNAHKKLKQDPRITFIGQFLRKTSLDEVPQCFNVLAGEMSLVGPRPVPVSEAEKYQHTSGDVGWNSYCSGLPGVTGLWQINGRNDTSYEERIDLDKSYRQRCSLGLDLYILLRTVKTVLLQEGAY